MASDARPGGYVITYAAGSPQRVVEELHRENARLRADLESWKDAWHKMRLIAGRAAWDMPPEGYGR